LILFNSNYTFAKSIMHRFMISLMMIHDGIMVIQDGSVMNHDCSMMIHNKPGCDPLWILESKDVNMPEPIVILGDIMAAEDAIKATVDELLKALSAKNIIGEPIEMEDKIIIPITKMGMGFGTGIGHGSDDASKGGVAGGAGGGVGVFPVAVVIVFKGVSGSDGVRVIPLSAPSPLAEPITNIAHLFMDKLMGKKEGREKKPGHIATIDVE